MIARCRRFADPGSRATTLALVLSLIALTTAGEALGRGGGGGGRGSVGSVNRSGGGGSWSGSRSSGTTSRSVSGNASSRTTTAQGAGGQTATGTRSATRSGDEVTVNRNVQSSSGASKSSQKTYTVDDGHVESVDRSVQATNRTGQSAEWQGSAHREGYGWDFEGQGTNRYGQKVSAEGYGARGPYGSGVVADVEGGRYGDRTVVAGRAYGGPVYAASLPYGARPYPYYGHTYYVHGGAYYYPYHYHSTVYYGYMPPPWGVYYTTVPPGSVTVTYVGSSYWYSNGVYYQTAYVQGGTQYVVVAPPAGVAIPLTSLPADRAAVTLAGVTYYLYANTFYKRLVVDGQERFVVVTKPAGVESVKELPPDVEPLQKGSLLYFRSQGRHFVSYLEPGGTQSYVVVDAPVGAVPAVAAEAGAAPASPAAPPAEKPSVVSLVAGPGTPLAVRLSTEINSGTAQPNQRFQGNLDADLVVDGRVIATRGSRVYGRVVDAKAGTGTGGQPVLVLELTDIDVGGRVAAVATDPKRLTGGEGKPAGAGGAALGDGIGTAIEGAAGAATVASPGNQLSVAPGLPVTFQLAKPLRIDVAG